MGQYYYPIVLDAEGKIVIWMCAHAYGNGLKLMEHSYIGNNFVSTFEFGLSPEGIYHKSRVVWAGDYAEPDTEHGENLYHKCTEYSEIRPQQKDTTKYRFVVNHSKRQFVDKTKVPKDRDDMRLHPLPLLTAEGNGAGGGDYRGKSENLVGIWARDVISVEETAPTDYEEFSIDFVYDA
jgi:hypothetical protein